MGKKNKSRDFLSEIKKSITSVDKEKKGGGKNDNQVIVEELIKSKITEKLDKSNKDFKFNINNQNIKALEAKIAKPKKEAKVYTTIYIKASVNNQIQQLADKFNISKGELIENIFTEFIK